MDKVTYIYGLWCPIKECFFYVGRSVDPVNRVRQHLYDVKPVAMARTFPQLYRVETNQYGYNARQEWMAWLVGQDLKPELIILEEITRVTRTSWPREKAWIERLISESHPLTNLQGRLTELDGEDEEIMQEAIQRGRDMFG